MFCNLIILYLSSHLQYQCIRFFSLTIEIDLGRNSKGDTKVYKVRCHKKCGSVSISLRTGRGDADLYGKEESPPIISDSNCNSCTLCKSRDSDLTDQCLVTTISKYLVIQCTEVLFFLYNVSKMSRENFIFRA